MNQNTEQAKTKQQSADKKFHMPSIGMRIIKSCIAVGLCYIFYILRGESGIVFYSQLSALWCIQPYVESSLKFGLQRTMGTLIGIGYSLIVVLFMYYIFPVHPVYVEYIVNSLMIIPVIYTSVFLHRKDASYFSCVVFLSVVVLHIDEEPLYFVWERFLDTMIGIVIGVAVNACHLPRRRKQNCLYISGLDNTLLGTTEKLSDYSVVELNRMLKDGIHFTVSTRRTPASLLEPLKGVNLNLPVIAMDGAVLYDTKTGKYIRSYVISYAMATEVMQKIRDAGFQCFYNAVVDDSLIIYHQELHNSGEKDLYKRMYSSPYRNYVSQEPPENTPCVYLLVLDEKEKVTALRESLEAQGYGEKLKFDQYDSDHSPGYAYFKIYNKTAKKENMIADLQRELGCDEVVTFGSVAGQYDYEVHDGNTIVRMIHKLYEPVGLPQRKDKAKTQTTS